ncbi:Por secretion system C-terminal sorting domain-containing protein [Soonwooa buanensis]|uniref:Por secretion system C-terminal sorting domain-containing protein n=1 Tax=Soonwooa buanensis TaxID=619805 RepID=A0A1T5GNR1_9FLAO|nr:T9SS type A sorting domain-containing protein [Soonwooa buanensis]SKC10065.1 Por secretion system C-terminal sorting domain-containing protein [Soonwooa buanensis]
MKKYMSMVFLLLYFAFGRSQNITAAEYFFNTDPGVGNATSIALSGTDVTQTYSIPVPNGMTGFNNMFVRAKNANNTWSFYNRASFYIYQATTQSSIAPISAAEYFFDNDPGLGNGNALTASGTDVNQTYTAVIPSNMLGFHNLYIRVKNSNNVWAFYHRATFYIGKLADLTIPALDGGEFFVDTDPGVGQGKQVTLTSAGTDTYTVDLSTVNIPCGLHNFYLRIKNKNNTYSIYQLAKDVNVYDNAPPTILAKDISIELDANAKASFKFADVDLGTKDDCQLASVTLSKTDFNCSNLGANTVKITATDALGKVSTKDIIITVLDKIKPVAKAKNISVYLDANGSVSITGAMLNNASTDNCSVVETTVSKAQFSCADLGANQVTLTVKDSSGNSDSTTATVTVLDNIAPTAIAKNYTAELGSNGSVSITAQNINNNSTDNCGISEMTLSRTQFSCGDIGNQNVTLTVKDASGNTSTATAVVSVVDHQKPNVLTKNITVKLDANASATITANMIDNGSTDNCGIAEISVNKTQFSCANLGSNQVILSVKDSSGNIATATATVSVIDDIAPIAIAKNYTAELGSNGSVSITAQNINNNSTDNCGISEMTLSRTQFSCGDIGNQNVTLTVKDASGNTSTATAVVSVVDNQKPNVLTKNITIKLDANASATITANMIDNGSTDNCSIVEISVNKTQFSCANLGSNQVTLSVKDSSGNIATATATVSVIDDIAPVAIGKDVSVEIANNETSVTIDPQTVNNGSSDNCGIASYSLSQTTFTEAGVYNVVFTVKDSSGNQSSITVQVTVTKGNLASSDFGNSKDEILLYPNPTMDILNIVSQKEIKYLTIIDASGKLVHGYKSVNKVDVKKLPSGTYLLIIDTIDGIRRTKKFIKKD